MCALPADISGSSVSSHAHSSIPAEAAGARNYGNGTDVSTSEDVSISVQRCKTITAKGMDRLNLEAGMALFFGAFAYFAVRH